MTGTYEFNVSVQDGVRLALGPDVLLDCFDTDRSADIVNCGSSRPATAKLYGGRHDFVIEYQALTGNKRLEVEWKPPGAASFEPLPESVLFPGLDLLTATKVGRVETATGAAEPEHFSATAYEYRGADAADNEDVIRRVPKRVATTGALMEEEASVYAYDDFGRVVSETDATGVAITRVYDSGGEVACETETTDRVGLKITRACNDSGDVATETATVAGEARTTTTAYDPLGRPVTVTAPDGGTTTAAYDEAGRLVRSAASVGGGAPERVTTYDYDAMGLLWHEYLPDPDGGGPEAAPVIAHGYDEVGNESALTDARGERWGYAYDAHNQRTERSDPLGNTWSLGYDLAGNLTSRTQPAVAGARVTRVFAYDLRSLRTSARFEGRPETKVDYTRDLRGLVVAESDPDSGLAYERGHDGVGRLITERRPVGEGGALAARTYDYDASGHLASERDFAGVRTAYETDAMGRVVRVATPCETRPSECPASDSHAIYARYEDGSLKRVTFPRAEGGDITAAYAYDLSGRLTSESDGEGNTTTTQHNHLGEPTRVEDPRGVVVTYAYDSLGRLDSRSATGGGLPTQSETFVHDAGGNLTRAENAWGVITATYDASGRIEAVTQGGATTAYAYAGHRLASRSDPAGITTYAYEGATGRLASVDDPLVAGAPTALTYTAAGRLQTRAEPTGVVHAFAYDRAGRLTSDVAESPPGETLAKITQAYDAASRVTAKTTEIKTGADDGTWSYAYDAASRLARTTDPQGVVTTYAYDASGNRTRVTTKAPDGSEVTRIATFDRASRITSEEVSATASGTSTPEVSLTTFAHDAAGNLTSRLSAGAGMAYAYDSLGRLSEARAVVDGLPAPEARRYLRDAQGRTVRTDDVVISALGEDVVASETSRYAGLTGELTTTELTEEIDGGIAEVVTHLASASGAPVLKRTEATTTLTSSLGSETTVEVTTSGVGTTPHGDVSYLTSEDGTEITGQRSYDPWGVPRAQVGETGPLGYQGDPTDDITGLVDMGARSYDPSLGRFLSKDPLIGSPENPISLNPYVYGWDDPMSMTDPEGLAPVYCPSGQRCGQAVEGGREGRGTAAGSTAPVTGASLTAYLPVYTQVREGAPGAYIDGHAGMFATRVEHIVQSLSVLDASDFFDVPPSVIAAVLETEFELDRLSPVERVAEMTVMRLVCANFVTGGTSLCGQRSVGVGQIQVRRADVVDDDVKRFFLSIASEDERRRISTWWTGDPLEIYGRLRNEHMNAVYVTAYLAALRAAHEPGTNWSTIYSRRSSQQLGEYNANPRFLRQFQTSLAYYRYLDL